MLAATGSGPAGRVLLLWVLGTLRAKRKADRPAAPGHGRTTLPASRQAAERELLFNLQEALLRASWSPRVWELCGISTMHH